MKSLTRAHRRCLGLTLPPHAIPPVGDHVLLQRVVVSRASFQMLIQQHLAANGRDRGGILLGYRDGESVYVSAVLPNGYGGAAGPYEPDSAYVLGAVDAAQQVSTVPLDWVGSWVMPGDGREPGSRWIEAAWGQARAAALVSEETVLVTMGLSDDGLTVLAYGYEDSGPLPLDVHREYQGTPTGS